jgi:nitrile hydratase
MNPAGHTRIPRYVRGRRGVVDRDHGVFITFRDGGPPKGDPCDPWGYHGYPGIESRVVIRITDWIKAAR